MKILTAALGACALAIAQQPPVAVHRIPPSDLSKPLGILEGMKAAPTATVPAVTSTVVQQPVVQATPPEPPPIPQPRAPRNWQPIPVKVPATAKKAAELSESFTTALNEPAAGPDGRVVFTFGKGLPVVMCAPLKLCVLELQQGEVVSGFRVGDPLHWKVSQLSSGGTPLFVVQLNDSGMTAIETDALVTTDKHIYLVRLVSDRLRYVGKASFTYPEEEQAALERELTKQAEESQRQASRAANTVISSIPIEQWNTNYRVEGKAKDLKPTWVGDNGKETRINWNPSVNARNLPVLMLRTPAGEDQIVTYRPDPEHHCYIVDRLFDHARLSLGTGKKQQYVDIYRERM